MKNKVLSILLPFVSVLLILIFWSVASYFVGSEFVLPNIKLTLKSFFSLFIDNAFYNALLFTLLRSFIAFFISFVLAFLSAFLSIKSQNFKKFLSPFFSICRALPTIAVVLLLLFWTTSFFAPIIVCILVVLPTLYLELTSAFLSVDKDALIMCKVFNVKKGEMIKKVYIPQVLPQMFMSIGGGLSLNIKLMVASEVLSQTAVSLGLMLNTSKVYFETAKMIALVLVVVIIGVVIEKIFYILSKRAEKIYD